MSFTADRYESEFDRNHRIIFSRRLCLPGLFPVNAGMRLRLRNLYRQLRILSGAVAAFRITGFLGMAIFFAAHQYPIRSDSALCCNNTAGQKRRFLEGLGYVQKAGWIWENRVSDLFPVILISAAYGQDVNGTWVQTKVPLRSRPRNGMIPPIRFKQRPAASSSPLRVLLRFAYAGFISETSPLSRRTE